MLELCDAIGVNIKTHTKRMLACRPCLFFGLDSRIQGTPRRGVMKQIPKLRRMMEMSKLVWRTAVGAVKVPVGTSHQLGIVDVSPYSKIRVVADERVGSGTGIVIRLTITEGSELVAQLDTLHLAPHSQVTQVYDVPAAKLTIYADALPGAGNDAVDVLVYGSP